MKSVLMANAYVLLTSLFRVSFEQQARVRSCLLAPSLMSKGFRCRKEKSHSGRCQQYVHALVIEMYVETDGLLSHSFQFVSAP
jgi:hypothetical protein